MDSRTQDYGRCCVAKHRETGQHLPSRVHGEGKREGRQMIRTGRKGGMKETGAHIIETRTHCITTHPNPCERPETARPLRQHERLNAARQRRHERRQCRAAHHDAKNDVQPDNYGGSAAEAIRRQGGVGREGETIRGETTRKRSDSRVTSGCGELA